ncbi:unnamed protein product [Cuscuta campestris]|uniref:Zinc finger, CCHC-type n=1 Tax=Cuscuta campestris TaxID=132261 RepID=A0A484KH16_9ASTE|nr:unnamed protein product [Cuscuta campestris]
MAIAYLFQALSEEIFADINTMPFQEAVGRLKAFEERIRKPTEEGDTHGKLLFTKGDGKEKVQEQKCEHCGCWSSNREDFGRGRAGGSLFPFFVLETSKP